MFSGFWALPLFPQKVDLWSQVLSMAQHCLYNILYFFWKIPKPRWFSCKKSILTQYNYVKCNRICWVETCSATLRLRYKRLGRIYGNNPISEFADVSLTWVVNISCQHYSSWWNWTTRASEYSKIGVHQSHNYILWETKSLSDMKPRRLNAIIENNDPR